MSEETGRRSLEEVEGYLFKLARRRDPLLVRYSEGFRRRYYALLEKNTSEVNDGELSEMYLSALDAMRDGGYGDEEILEFMSTGLERMVLPGSRAVAYNALGESVVPDSKIRESLDALRRSLVSVDTLILRSLIRELGEGSFHCRFLAGRKYEGCDALYFMEKGSYLEELEDGQFPIVPVFEGGVSKNLLGDFLSLRASNPSVNKAILTEREKLPRLLQYLESDSGVESLNNASYIFL